MREPKPVICQCCGEEIKGGDPAVKVEYGQLGFTGHPHAKIYGKECDWFHRGCDVAIRRSE